jgi:hypothetical protein
MISPPPQKRLIKLLFKILMMSAVAHIAMLILFGGYTVYRYVISSGADFEEPPAVIDETPPPTSVEVSIQRPSAAIMPGRELTMQSVGSIAVPALAGNIGGLQESFAIADAGGDFGSLRLGGASSLGLGISEITVFGIRDSGERILFAVDAGRNMMLDSKGGLHSYNAIKEELIRLINGLSPGTLFNVIVFEGTSNRSSAFRPTLVPAIPTNFEVLSRWFMPINQRADAIGLGPGNIPIGQALTEHPVGQTFAQSNARRWPPQPWLTQIALEQNADLIYVITANWQGFTTMVREITDRETEQIARDRARLEATSAFQRELRLYLEEEATVWQQIRAKEAAEAAERRRRNLPPRIWFHAGEGRHAFNEKRRAYDIAMRHRDPRPVELFWPQESTRYRHDARAMEDYFRSYLRIFYRNENKPVPRMNLILFLAEAEDLPRETVEGIRGFLRHFNNGRFRELRGLAAIQATTTER